MTFVRARHVSLIAAAAVAALVLRAHLWVCAHGVSQTCPQAQAAPAVPPPNAGAAPPPAGLLPLHGFAIVPGESSVTFAVPDNRGGFSGHTTQVTGRVEVEPPAGETYTARIAASVDAGSLTTGVGIRDSAMRSTFLQTGTYPAITFTGTATARPGLAIRSFPADVRGRLVIRDVAREQVFTATVLALANQYVADAKATVRMVDYGIPYPRAFIFVARDPVTVTLHIVARAP